MRIGGPDPNLNLNVPALPIPTLTPNRENQYLQRIKELENEIRQARVENEKNVRPGIQSLTSATRTKMLTDL